MAATLPVGATAIINGIGEGIYTGVRATGTKTERFFKGVKQGAISAGLSFLGGKKAETLINGKYTSSAKRFIQSFRKPKKIRRFIKYFKKTKQSGSKTFIYSAYGSKINIYYSIGKSNNNK